MKTKISKHVTEHLELIRNNHNDISSCIISIAKLMVKIFKSKFKTVTIKNINKYNQSNEELMKIISR